MYDSKKSLLNGGKGIRGGGKDISKFIGFCYARQREVMHTRRKKKTYRGLTRDPYDCSYRLSLTSRDNEEPNILLKLPDIFFCDPPPISPLERALYLLRAGHFVRLPAYSTLSVFIRIVQIQSNFAFAALSVNEIDIKTTSVCRVVEATMTLPHIRDHNYRRT